MQHQQYITKQLEYVTKDHIATHTILCKLKMVPFFNLLNGITALNNIILLIIQSCLYVPQASSSFKCCDTHTPT